MSQSWVQGLQASAGQQASRRGEVEVTVAPGPNTVRLQLAPRPCLQLRLVDGGLETAASREARLLEDVQLSRVDGAPFESWTRPGSGRIDVSEPGLYRVEVRLASGLRPLPAAELLLEAGRPVVHELTLEHDA